MLIAGSWKRIAKLAALTMSLCLTLSVISFAAGPPPVINVQPSDTTVSFNGTATFSVSVYSSTTLSYQWRKDGVNISGATQSTYTIAEAKASSAGAYSVKLINGGGTVVSSNATLTVLMPPEITTQPRNQTIVKGQNTSFSVVATGAAPLVYQWRLNNVPVSGALGSEIVVSNVQPTSAGCYQVVISNFLGSVTSSVATLVLQNSQTRIGGSADDDDYVQATAVDAQGNVYLTGYARNNSTEYDYVTVKYDSSSNLIWRAVYNGPASRADQASYLAVDSAGNVYVSGSSESDSSGKDYATVKYDSNGNQLWAKRYNGTAGSDDLVRGLAVDGNGNVFVTGASRGSGSRYNFVTLKYDSSGNQVWLQRYISSGNQEDQAASLALDLNGNVYVTGKSKGLLSGFDYSTLKYANDGTQLWEAHYAGDLLIDDVPSKVVVDASGNVYVTGYSQGLLGSVDYLTVKYNSKGVQQWTATYNGSANKSDQPVDIALDKEGNVFVTGFSEVTSGNADYATVKYSPAGQQLWVARYNGSASGDDRPSALAFDPAGDVYVVGSSKGSNDHYDFATVKYLSATGTEAWASRFHSSANIDEAAVALAIDNEFNLYVAGKAFDKLDYTLLRYQSGPYSPIILAQPASRTVSEGQTTSFSVTVAGTKPMTFQWKRNDSFLAEGSTGILTLNPARLTNAGSYSVTIMNSAGTASSTSALLTVTNSPSTLSVGSASEVPRNGFAFQVSLNPGSTYVVSASTNCTDWFPIATNIATNANILINDVFATNFSKRFYRVLVK